MPYFCTICKGRCTREDRCETCGWVKTYIVKEVRPVSTGIQQRRNVVSNAVLDGKYLNVVKIL